MTEFTAKICHIVGAGELTAADVQRYLTVCTGDLVIAADGGIDKLIAAGVTPDLVIGDFDSARHSPESLGVPVVRLPTHKDMTDMAAAIDEGLRVGYRQFRLYGACGGRADHTFANYQLIAGLSARGCDAVIIDGEHRVSGITNGTLTLPEAARGTVSVFAHGGDATGVTLMGFAYPLVDAHLTPTVPLGVSNERIPDTEGVVCVEKGTLLIMWTEPLDKCV